MLFNDSIECYSNVGTDYPWVVCTTCGQPFPYYDGKLHEWKNGLVKEHTHSNNTPLYNDSEITILLTLAIVYLMIGYIIKYFKK